MHSLASKLSINSVIRFHMKRGVKIIECLDEQDPGSEGRCLKHIFNLMQIESSYSHVSSIEELISTIVKSNYQYIHVSAHGSIERGQNRFQGWWTPNGIGNRAQVMKLAGKVKANAIISTACKSGTAGFGRYVVDKLGCQYYIGPVRSPFFHNSAFFSHIFYHKLFMTKDSVLSAFRSYTKNYKNPHGFSLYERGK